jgi:hypothetical protein
LRYLDNAFRGSLIGYIPFQIRNSPLKLRRKLQQPAHITGRQFFREPPRLICFGSKPVDLLLGGIRPLTET